MRVYNYQEFRNLMALFAEKVYDPSSQVSCFEQFDRFLKTHKDTP